MAKPVLKEFIEGRPNDRIGLVVFAAQAFIATPHDARPRLFARKH